LAAPLSQTSITLVRQQSSHEVWRKRALFEFFASDLVLEEASDGNAAKVKDRLIYLQNMSLLPISKHADAIAQALVDGAALPLKARADANHIAIAACAGMDYVLSWNFKHIVNPITLPLTHKILSKHKLRPPVICTPDHLLEILT
jgi:hypothetical protein